MQKQAMKNKPRKAVPRKSVPRSNVQIAPAAHYMSRPYKPPVIKRNKPGSCTMAHEEFLFDVTGTIAFTVANKIEVNPGLFASFPWLAAEAQGWERFRFKRLSYRLVTSTGSTTPGTIILAPDYDAADIQPSTQQIALAYEDRLVAAPWELSRVMNLPVARLNAAYKQYYCRSGPVAANQDVKTYDPLNIYVCTVGGTAVSWGKLFVSYEVEFFSPQIPSAGFRPSGGQITGGGAITGANPLGSVPVAKVLNSGFTVGATSIISFLALGDYTISLSVAGTVITAFPAVVAGAGATIVFSASSFPTAATSGTAFYVVRISSLAAATVALSVTATTITASLLYLGQAPDLVFT